MHFSDLDAYFHMAAHGNQEAYQFLYKEFFSKAERALKSAGYNLTKYPGIHGDFVDLTDNEFLNCLNDYDSEKGNFSHFFDFILTARVVPEAIELICRWATKKIDLDYEEAEMVMAEKETPQSYSKKRTDSYAISNFRLRMSSSAQRLSNEERLERKFLLLTYAGCKAGEIKKKMKITDSQYRTLLQKVRDGEEITKLKLELK